MKDRHKQHPQWQASDETFCLPLGDGKMALFVPRKGIIALVNEAVVTTMREATQGELGSSEEKTGVLKSLQEAGILNGTAGVHLQDIEEAVFAPTCVSLYLTNACNLRCIYCYANGGADSNIRTIPIEAAKAGIDFVARNAINNKERAFSVNFHGAGEPTLAWEIYQYLVAYAKEIAERHGILACLTTCTNGVMSLDKARWIAHHTNYATVSLDGIAPAQDQLRPRFNGSGSFAAVHQTMQIFERESFDYMIRGTVCQDNVADLPVFVQWLCENSNADTFQFEPMMTDGRCFTSGCAGPDEATFVNAFSDATAIASSRGRTIGVSTLSLRDLRTYYCCAEADGFTITHDGLLTACFGVSDSQHPFAGTFVYGRYNPSTKAFDIDMDRVQQLRKRNTSHMGNLPKCDRCFCKYFCNGDCALNSLRSGRDLTDGSRCQLTRALALNIVCDTLGLAPRRHTPSSLQENDDSFDDRLSAFRSSVPISTAGKIDRICQYDVHESWYMRSPPTNEMISRLMAKGNIHVRCGRLQNALTTYDLILRQDAACIGALANSATALARMCRPSEALVRSQKASMLAPADENVQVIHARTLAASGKGTQAINFLKRNLNLHPDWAAARLALAWLYNLNNNKHAVLDCLAPLLKKKSVDQQFLSQAQQLAATCTREGVGNDSQNDGWRRELSRMLRSNLMATLDLEQASEVLNLGPLLAAEQYETVLERVSDSGLNDAAPLLFHWLSGLCRTHMGCTNEAEAHLSHAIPLMPRLYLRPAPNAWRLLTDGWNCQVEGENAVVVVPGLHVLAVEYVDQKSPPSPGWIKNYDIDYGMSYDISISGLKKQEHHMAYRV